MSTDNINNEDIIIKENIETDNSIETKYIENKEKETKGENNFSSEVTNTNNNNTYNNGVFSSQCIQQQPLNYSLQNDKKEKSNRLKIALLILGLITIVFISFCCSCCFLYNRTNIKNNDDLTTWVDIGSSPKVKIPNNSFGIGEQFDNEERQENIETFLEDIDENSVPIESAKWGKVKKTKYLNIIDSNDISIVVEEIYPSVVAITTSYNVSANSLLLEQNSFETYAAANASGVIIKQTEEELFIVTNTHAVSDMTTTYGEYIVNENYDYVLVTFANGEEAYAYIKGTNQKTDIAIIAVPLENIKQETLDFIRIANVGNSNDLKLGQTVIAIGNPLGYGLSVTKGIVSAKNVEVQMDKVNYLAIQTDAAINPGNSGGGLFNINGELIGINSAKSANLNVEGMGFSIPISSINDLIETLSLQNGDEQEKADALSKKGGLGITCITIDEELSKELSVPCGVLVYDINIIYPSYKDGLYYGDVITSFNGINVNTVEELIALIDEMNIGDKVVLEIKRCDNQEEFEPLDKWYTMTIETKLGRQNTK